MATAYKPKGYMTFKEEGSDGENRWRGKVNAMPLQKEFEKQFSGIDYSSPLTKIYVG